VAVRLGRCGHRCWYDGRDALSSARDVADHVVGDDGGDDAAIGDACDPALRPRPRHAEPGSRHRGKLGFLGRLSDRVAALLAGGCYRAMAARRAIDDLSWTLVRRNCPARRGPLPALAAKGRMRSAVPLASAVHQPSLAERKAGSRSAWCIARGLLRRLLLDVDGAPVCRGRDEPAVDRGTDDVGGGREACTAGSAVRTLGRCCYDRLGLCDAPRLLSPDRLTSDNR